MQLLPSIPSKAFAVSFVVAIAVVGLVPWIKTIIPAPIEKGAVKIIMLQAGSDEPIPYAMRGDVEITGRTSFVSIPFSVNDSMGSKSVIIKNVPRDVHRIAVKLTGAAVKLVQCGDKEGMLEVGSGSHFETCVAYYTRADVAYAEGKKCESSAYCPIEKEGRNFSCREDRRSLKKGACYCVNEHRQFVDKNGEVESLYSGPIQECIPRDKIHSECVLDLNNPNAKNGKCISVVNYKDPIPPLSNNDQCSSNNKFLNHDMCRQTTRCVNQKCVRVIGNHEDQCTNPATGTLDDKYCKTYCDKGINDTEYKCKPLHSILGANRTLIRCTNDEYCQKEYAVPLPPPRPKPCGNPTMKDGIIVKCSKDSCINGYCSTESNCTDCVPFSESGTPNPVVK